MMFQGFSLQLFVLVALLSLTSSLPTRREYTSFFDKARLWAKINDYYTKEPTANCPWGASIDLDAEGGSYTLTSPDYPAAYSNRQNCMWKITAAPGMLVDVAFSSSFDVEGKYGCYNDELKVSYMLYCNGMAPLKRTTQYESPFIISFHSDGEITGTGYNITLTQVDPADMYPHSKYPVTGKWWF